MVSFFLGFSGASVCPPSVCRQPKGSGVCLVVWNCFGQLSSDNPFGRLNLVNLTVRNVCLVFLKTGPGLRVDVSLARALCFTLYHDWLENKSLIRAGMMQERRGSGRMVQVFFFIFFLWVCVYVCLTLVWSKARGRQEMMQGCKKTNCCWCLFSLHSSLKMDWDLSSELMPRTWPDTPNSPAGSVQTLLFEFRLNIDSRAGSGSQEMDISFVSISIEERKY